MKAILLAAGKGGRLSPHTDHTPKCLIEIGGKSILDFQLDALSAAGINEIVIVVGYLKEKIVNHLTGRHGLEFKFIENADYARTNTAYSLWLARHEMTEDFVYLNGDVLVHPEIIRRLTRATATEALAVERKPCGEEEVKAVLEGARITALSKTVSPAEAYGEFIGIAKFSRSFGPSFRAALEDVIERDCLLNVYFEAALERLLDTHTLTSVDITDLPSIEIDFPEDLARAENVILPLFSTGMTHAPRILFYIERNLHIPFLEPVFDRLSEMGGFELAWCTVPYLEPGEGRPGMGLDSKERERLGQKGPFIGDIKAFSPDVTVCADACTHLRDCGKLVFVGHGMISKGGFYTDSPLVRRENMADVICVPGPSHRDILRKNVFSPIVVTGFIKSDTFFGPESDNIRKQFRQRHSIPDGARVILFAPTFNEELSAIPCVGERIGEFGDEHTIILIKLHTMTDVNWVKRYRELAARNPSVRYIDDIDAAPALLASDVMISDVSSVVLEYMLLDKPVIVFNNPRMGEYPHLNHSDVEYRVRDACLQVGNMDELRVALDRCWADPGEFSGKRLQYAEMYSYGRDGRCSHRVAGTVRQLLEGGFDHLHGRPSISIIALWDSTPGTTGLMNFIREIDRTAKGCDLDIYCIGNRPACIPEGLPVESWLDCACPGGAHLNKLAMMCGGDYLVLTSPSISFPADWPRWMANHFRFNPRAGAVMALSDSHNYRLVADQVFPGIRFPDLTTLSESLLSTVMGMSLESQSLSSPCVMIPRKKVFECGGFPPSPVGQSIRHFGQKLREQGYSIHQALDVFCRNSDIKTFGASATSQQN